MAEEFLGDFYKDLEKAGLGKSQSYSPAALPVYRAWAAEFMDRLDDRFERRSFLYGAGTALRASGREAESAHFWIQVYKDCLDRDQEELSSDAWQLMDSIAMVATEENFDELAELTEDPLYIQYMTMAYKGYFARSKDPRVPEVLRRLMEPEEIHDPGRIMFGAEIAANRKFVELIPNAENLLVRLRQVKPEGHFEALEDALYRLYRARYVQALYAVGKPNVDVSMVLADLDGADLQVSAFAAYVLGDLKAVAALPRLRELQASRNVRVRREAKAAVKKLEKVPAS